MICALISSYNYSIPSITFAGRAFPKISNLFRHQFNVRLKNLNFLYGILFNNKDRIDKIQTSGINELTFSCSDNYVGSTFRNFRKRMREQVAYKYRGSAGFSQFSEHSILYTVQGLYQKGGFITYRTLQLCDYTLIFSSVKSPIFHLSFE